VVEEEEDTGVLPLTRSQRFRKARDEEARAFAALEAGIRKPQKADEEATESGSQADGKRAPVYLKRVIFWEQDHPDSEERIPPSLLQLAFLEIDKDRGGAIDVGEFIDALNACGLKATRAATERIMADIDKNNSGDIDIFEFVKFFEKIQELNQFSKRSQQRAQCFTFVCNCCFVVMIFVVGTLLLTFIRMENKSSDDYKIVSNLLTYCSVALIVLCLCVIVMPALRLSLGPSITAWQRHYELNFTGKKRGSSGDPEPAAGTVQAPAAGGPRDAGWVSNTKSWSPQPQAMTAGSFSRSYRTFGKSGPSQQMQMQAAHEMREPADQDPVEYFDQPVEETQFPGEMASQPPGAIVDSRGEFLCYDPAAYRRSAMNSMETRQPASFNPMQVHSLQTSQGMLQIGDGRMY